MRRLAPVLFYAGTLAIVAGFGKLHAVRYAYDYTGGDRAAWTIAYVAVLCVAAYGVGFPDDARRGRGMVASAVVAVVAAGLGMSLLQLAVAEPLLPRFVIVASAVALVPWYVLCASVSNGGRARAEERDRVVVIAQPQEVEALRDDLGRAPERFAQVVAALSPDEIRAQPPIRSLVETVLEERATLVVLSRAAQADDGVVDEAARVHESGIRVRTLSLFYEEWLGKLPVSDLERVSLMFDIGEVHRAYYGRVKRMIDVAFAAIGAVALLVVAPFIVFGDLLANGGPLLYRQARVGRNGEVIEILKFRTMRPGPDLPVNEWTSENDPRITPFGRILRKSHLDELPQVINILRGDLSVVGPRPEQPHYVEELTGKIAFYQLRHLVRPGLTGWAQVKYGYAGTQSDALEKLQYEFYYLRHQSLRLDLRVVWRTIRSVVKGEGL